VVTVLLYLLVFSSVLSERLEVYKGVHYVTFLIPGLIIMSMLQNAFANSSSSLFQSKMNRNIVFMLLAPLSNLEIYIAYIAACVVRGIFVGAGVWITAYFFETVWIHDIPLVLAFSFLGCGILGALGLSVQSVQKNGSHRSISEFCHTAIILFERCFLLNTHTA
jgi:ABC-2 type transport system permease protein